MFIFSDWPKLRDNQYTMIQNKVASVHNLNWNQWMKPKKKNWTLNWSSESSHLISCWFTDLLINCFSSECDTMQPLTTAFNFTTKLNPQLSRSVSTGTEYMRFKEIGVITGCCTGLHQTVQVINFHTRTCIINMNWYTSTFAEKSWA